MKKLFTIYDDGGRYSAVGLITAGQAREIIGMFAFGYAQQCRKKGLPDHLIESVLTQAVRTGMYSAEGTVVTQDGPEDA